MTEADIGVAALRDLSPRVVYEIARLRVDVFVVEQKCPYPELDGRDPEDSALHFWVSEGDRVVSTLRLLRDPDAVRIGRVATAADHRGRGLSALLMRAALGRCGTDVVVLGAQAQLEGWYGKFGFVRCGENYDEDGIPHVPMRREYVQVD